MTAPSELNADRHFYEINELAAMSLEDLQSLWDSVPTEDQAYLVRVFEREADKRQVVEDIDESRMARHFIEQYQEMAFVPAGDVWVKVPAAAQEQYKLPLVEDPTSDDSPNAASNALSPQSPATTFPRWLILLAVPFACLILFAIIRMVAGGNTESNSEIVATATLTPTSSPTPTVTPTPLPPTATPFSLSGFDDTIRSGERVSREYFPVQLQIFPDAGTLPRVFIVQEQEIGVAEWPYDPNPDVVSWLSGMLIRSVLGVPFSPANLDLFRSLNDESIFVVTMNTGDVLQFIFSDTQQISRADTSHFRQDEPGLVLVLIGETFADGSPTDLRFLVQADYPADQEMPLLTGSNNLVAMGESEQIADVMLTVSDTRLLPSSNLPPELAYAVLDVQVVTGNSSFSPATWQWFLEVSGERILHDPAASELGTCSAVNEMIPANTGGCISVGFIVPTSLADVRLLVGSSADDLTRFTVLFSPAPVIVGHSDLDVQLGRISYTKDTLTVSARIFNPTEEAISITASDFSLVLGFVPNPTGPAILAAFEPTTIDPVAALDLSLDFPYSGEGFGMLTVMGRVWTVEITDQ